MRSRSRCAKPSVTLGGGVFKSPGHVSFLKVSRQSDKQSQFWHMNARLMTLWRPKLCAGQTFSKSLFSWISVALQFTQINPHFIGICGDPTTPVDGEGVKPQKKNHCIVTGNFASQIISYRCVCDNSLASTTTETCYIFENMFEVRYPWVAPWRPLHLQSSDLGGLNHYMYL